MISDPSQTLVIADIQQLTKRDVNVIVVLDGGNLPQKDWARKKRDKDLPGATYIYTAYLNRFRDNSQKVLQEGTAGSRTQATGEALREPDS